MTAAPVTGRAKLLLNINGTLYTVRRLYPHPAVALIAWRLTRKDGNDSKVYDVHEDGYGLHCDCPDHEHRREGRDYQDEDGVRRPLLCKHCLALQAVGLIGASCDS